jgi:signal transduction histidine kinase
MERITQIRQLMRRSRRLPVLGIGLSLGILAAAIAVTTIQVRQGIREQIAGRDGEILHALALSEYASDVNAGLAGPITDAGNQLSVVLKSSQLENVLAIRLYNSAGEFVESFPPDVVRGEIRALDLAVLTGLKPVSHFRPRVALVDLFMAERAPDQSGGQTIPLLEVNVPLHTEEGPLAGVAQFLLEGNSIQAEFALLDRRLAWQAAMAIGAGGLLLALTIGWAFRRLRQAQRLLADRTENLVKANQELALAAKTSALGVVTAHLIHGLKNPLAGLQSFMAARGGVPAGMEEADWEQAASSTRRMQSMINQVVSVLREEQTGARYELLLSELNEVVSSRVSSLAREREVRFAGLVQHDAVLSNRVANLVALILVNLIQNALQATPRGGAVSLQASRVDEAIVFEVRDEGPGFPAELTPFVPCRTAKEGGCGLGLALSKQLANHLGASLELKGSTSQGCHFALTLPAGLSVDPSGRVEITMVD